ncbi:adenylosuccinate synthase [Porphyromonas gingivalis]|uniref:Adenylosuccinate synthetase n=1 Tax=Porphyromonas gingivalis TaxID=837 RepID=A0AAE9XIG2_PORGN|nr:adenylosuccinate synthase [Porphyromonas gingivalis]WCG03671.1 adenylosuccinate synthase [Porphyromonas gingivalis]SJL31804.1 adenylosuccinate synthetase [Porphyromonas gingivalis]
MEKVDVLLGLQWGDEGKGKIVDVLTPHYDIVARFQGGPNAGHTLEFNGEKYVLRSIPSGIFQGEKTNVIGNGVVLDPLLFKEEAEALARSGHDLTKRLVISRKAHLIMPTHRLLDAANEMAKGSGKIGTTGKGIGPTYTDKVSRNGLRVGDLEHGFEEAYSVAKERHLRILNSLNYPTNELADLEERWMEATKYLRKFEFVDSEFLINGALSSGKKVLAEGAQGSLLDIDFGSYPFVTSSNTICAGCCTGLGVAPRNVGDVYGIFKAYCTRVGAGPFPTELFDETGDKLCELGREFGSVTGRKRRCGWIDLVALRYTIMLNGVTKLIMMKSDVMDLFPTIKACVAYEIDGKETRNFPFHLTEGVTPVYKELPGWQQSMTNVVSEADFSKEFSDYIAFLEKELGVGIAIVSVGPDREQTIIRQA